MKLSLWRQFRSCSFTYSKVNSCFGFRIRTYSFKTFECYKAVTVNFKTEHNKWFDLIKMYDPYNASTFDCELIIFNITIRYSEWTSHWNPSCHELILKK